MLDEVQERLKRIREEAAAWCEASVQEEEDIVEFMADDVPWMLDLISAQAKQLSAQTAEPLEARRPIKEASAWAWADTGRCCRTVKGGDPNDLADLLAVADDKLWVTWSGPGFVSENRVARGSAGSLQANKAAASAKLVAWGFVLNGPEEVSDV